jgi:ferric-dicitrate binding protein FerR (iron transport regulator)
MKSKNERVSQLMQQYLDNKLTAEAYRELWELLNENIDKNSFKEELQLLWENAKTEKPLIPAEEWDYKMQVLKNKLTKETIAEPGIQKRAVRMNKYWWAAAAALLIFISSAIYFLANKKQNNTSAIAKNNQPAEQKHDRLPGGDRALLTLADGSQIVLDSAGNGILAQQGNTNIVKQQDGQLVYKPTGPGTDEIAYNALATPRGGQYKITLPDGSKVWLNAASSLKYPAAFTGNDRKVEITGEAYFEIAKDASRPFKVQVNQMEVEVLGTHFNINGYADEEVIRTTLLEGRVKINTKDGNNFLKPGQQAQLQKTGKIKLVDDADLEETMAWKDGNFQFENSDINTVMRQITRWYDVDIEYKGTVSKHFLGTISRNVNLSQVLTMLQQTGEVKFIVEGKKVIVMP